MGGKPIISVMVTSHGEEEPFILQTNSIGGAMVSILTSSVVDCGFEPGQFKP